MASQLYSVRNAKRRGYQVDEMNARRGMLPQLIANRQRNEDIDRQQSQWDRSYALQKQASKLADRQSQIGMGVEGIKMGTNLLSSYGSKTIGGPSGLFKGYSGAGSGVNIGSGAAGLFGGFGASNLLKSKNKYKKAAVGAGAGALMGLLGGGGGGGIASGSIGGLVGGLLGSLF